MSALTASMSLIVNATPTPHAPQPPAQADNGFARCLDRARDDNEAAPPDEAAPRPSVKKPPPHTRAERDAREPRAARAAGASEAPPKAPSDVDSEDATADTPHDDATAPDLAALLPGWAPPPTVAPAAAAAESSGSSPTSMAIGNTKAATALPQDDPSARALAQLAAAPTAAETNGEPATTALASSAELQAAASEQRSAAPDLSSAPLLATLPSAPAATATSASTARAAEAPLPSAALPAPIDSPAFAPSLATQVRWWASDGVQQAQLLLNPAEMGPVAVKILLEGREARIDFSADLAATRGAIEAALPVLAAALDDGGLKLSGGGVHDGSAQRQPEWSARGPTQRTATASIGSDTAPPTPAARSATARGMVDLVA
jgi:flagellar hook-length control protein FliK